MAKLEIVKWPDARLTTVCDPVAPGDDLGVLIRDMFDAMYDANGRGLAAPQVGVLKRLFVMDCSWKIGEKSPIACINPQIVEQSVQVETVDEGCLSIPGILIAVARPDWVVLSWTNSDGDAQSQRQEGPEARIVQHELDHLDGIVTFLRLDAARRNAAEAEYSTL
ncbi:MAG: peptide deformylase [Rhodobacteraceae bacterium]|nr:peptide deformylase [Paracoccaceae bacterium]